MSQFSVLDSSALDTTNSSSDDSFGGDISDWLTEKDNILIENLGNDGDTHGVSSEDKENNPTNCVNSCFASTPPPCLKNVSNGNLGLYKDRNVSSSKADLHLVMIPDSEYIRHHLDEFSALCEVEDLDFVSKNVTEQEAIIRSMNIVTFAPGQHVFEMGDSSADFYIVVADQRTCATAHVEVVRDGRVLTRLYRGQYFGQMQFLTRQIRSRNASIRVPASLASPGIQIACISEKHFEHWSFFRNMLIVRAVPFLNQLSLTQRLDLLALTLMKHYHENECIIKQGDAGDCFYILLDGSVLITEDLSNGNSEQLAVLRAGHCFGELALATNEPRVANVYSVGNTTCLALFKESFITALSTDAFAAVVSDLLESRRRTRRHRDTVRGPVISSSSSIHSLSQLHGEWSGITHLSASCGDLTSSSSSSSSSSYSSSSSDGRGQYAASNSIDTNHGVNVATIFHAATTNGASIGTDTHVHSASHVLFPEDVLVLSESPLRGEVNNRTTDGVVGGGRMSISDNAVLKAYRTPTRPMRRTFSEPIDITPFPVTETKHLNVSKLETGDKCVNGKYRLEHEIGKGSFGDVWQVLDLVSNCRFAMKTINRQVGPIKISTSVSEVWGEIDIMKRLRNDNVVRLFEVIDAPSAKKLYLIQELMDGPLLPDTLCCHPLSNEQCLRYFRDIVRGVHYLHSQGIVHRDIKPQNILICECKDKYGNRNSNGSSKKIAKIGDLGAAVFTGGHEKSTFHGTPAYTAPELNVPHEQRTHNYSRMPCIDMFALGATLYCMCVGHPPWMADTELVLADKIRNLEPQLAPSTDPHLRHLILRLLEKDWLLRANMDDVVCDAWVTDEGSNPLFDFFHEEEEEEEDEDEEDVVASKIEVEVEKELTEESIQSLESRVFSSCIMPFNVDVDSDNVPKTCVPSCSKQEGNVRSKSSDLPPTLTPSVNLGMTLDLSMGSELLTPLTQDYNVTERVLPRTTKLVSHTHTSHKYHTHGHSSMHLLSLSDSSSSSSSNSSDSSINASVTMRNPLPHSHFRGHLASSSNSGKPLEEISAAAAALRRKKRVQSIQISKVLSTQNHIFSRSTDKDVGENDHHSTTATATATTTCISSVTNKCNNNSDDYAGDDADDNEEIMHMLGSVDVILRDRNSSERDGECDCEIFNSSNNSVEYNEPNSDDNDDDSESEYDIKVCLDNATLEDIFDPLCARPTRPATSSWDCVVASDGTISAIDTARGCLSPIPVHTFVSTDTDTPCANMHARNLSSSRLPLSLPPAVDVQHILSNLKIPVSIPVPPTVPALSSSSSSSSSSSLQHSIAMHVPALNIGWVMAQSQGSRQTMEDYMASTVFNSEVSNSPIGMMSLFDGHGGRYVAETLSKTVGIELEKALHMKTNNNTCTNKRCHHQAHPDFNLNTSTNSIEENSCKQALRYVCALMDRNILAKDYMRQCVRRQSRHSGRGGKESLVSQTYGGSTGNIVLVRAGADSSKIHADTQTHKELAIAAVTVTIANVGDCRSVLCTKGKCKQLTTDHKPNNLYESNRIIQAGGTVVNGRVGGSLGVSRAFGDIHYKTVNDSILQGDVSNNADRDAATDTDVDVLSWAECELWNTRQLVISLPELVEHEVCNDDEFLLSATDGLWDLLSCETAVNCVRFQLLAHGDVTIAAQQLLVEAEARARLGSVGADNISLSLCVFNQKTCTAPITLP